MEVNWNLLVQSLIIGVASGGLIALIALGYTLVYGIVELINFAHGDVFMIGAVTALTAVGFFHVSKGTALPEVVGIAVMALALAMIVSGLLNFAIDRIAYRRLRNAPRLAPLIAAIGFSFILQNVGIYWLGSNPVTAPALIPTQYRSFNVLTQWFGLDTRIRLRLIDVAVLGIAIPLLVLLTWFIYRTRTGKAMRAVAQDREAAALMGIDINRTISIAFLIGGALAGAAGMIALFYNNSARFQMGFRYGLFAFTAAVLGGIGNLSGAVVGGLCIGIVWALSDGYMQEYVPAWGAQWTPAVIFAVLVIVMVFKPSGLLGEQTADKV